MWFKCMWKKLRYGQGKAKEFRGKAYKMFIPIDLYLKRKHTKTYTQQHYM